MKNLELEMKDVEIESQKKKVELLLQKVNILSQKLQTAKSQKNPEHSELVAEQKQTIELQKCQLKRQQDLITDLRTENDSLKVKQEPVLLQNSDPSFEQENHQFSEQNQCSTQDQGEHTQENHLIKEEVASESEQELNGVPVIKNNGKQMSTQIIEAENLRIKEEVTSSCPESNQLNLTTDDFGIAAYLEKLLEAKKKQNTTADFIHKPSEMISNDQEGLKPDDFQPQNKTNEIMSNSLSEIETTPDFIHKPSEMISSLAENKIILESVTNGKTVSTVAAGNKIEENEMAIKFEEDQMEFKDDFENIVENDIQQNVQHPLASDDGVLLNTNNSLTFKTVHKQLAAKQPKSSSKLKEPSEEKMLNSKQPNKRSKDQSVKQDLPPKQPKSSSNSINCAKDPSDDKKLFTSKHSKQSSMNPSMPIAQDTEMIKCELCPGMSLLKDNLDLHLISEHFNEVNKVKYQLNLT